MEGKVKTALFLIFLLVVVTVIYITGLDITPQRQISEELIAPSSDNLTYVASWNIQIFGDSKYEKVSVRNSIKEMIRDYDIVFIQEIRDADGSSFDSLCGELEIDFNCAISSRAGRSTSKEQIGIVYKKDIKLVSLEDLNPDPFDRWERPPIKATFMRNDYIFHVWNIHTKPTDAVNEIQNLETVVNDDGNVIIMGDLNADCDYYDPLEQQEFISWKWLIGDDQDTTVGDTFCSYDRIIVNSNAYGEVSGYGIDNRVTEQVSDHYVVWVSLEA